MTKFTMDNIMYLSSIVKIILLIQFFVFNLPATVNSTSIEYTGSTGRDYPHYNVSSIMYSDTNKILQKYSNIFQTENSISKLREKSKIDNECKERIEVASSSEYNYKLPCFRTGCLFNIKDDPCEFNDLSQNMKDTVLALKEKLNLYKKELVNQTPLKIDPKSDPIYWDRYWTPWIIENYSYYSSLSPRILGISCFLSIMSLCLIVIIK